MDKKDVMTPRERWLAILQRKKPDRMPMDYWATPEFSVKLIKYLGMSSEPESKLLNDLQRYFSTLERTQGYFSLVKVLKYLHIDFLLHVSPQYVGPRLNHDSDVFGCKYREIDYGTGTYSEVVSHPLANYQTVEEIQNHYTWPNPDWWNYDVLEDQIKGWEEYPIRGGGSEPLLTYKYLRGEKQAMMDLVINPEIAHYCLDKLFELAYQDTLRIYEKIPGKVLLSYVAEDMGGQDKLMYSKKVIREFLLPRMKRMIDLAHQAGVYVFHHNDGNCREILTDLIDLGIDILNPIQWRCRGMDRKMLKVDFGDRIIFHGGMDNQHTLPFGTIEDVRTEVEENIRILGENGGYILAPCHNIQSITPVENILEMYQAGYYFGD